jgi:uncharacterized protein
MSEQENTKVVRQAYESFQQGNIPGVLGLLSEGVEWKLPQIENVPFSGARVGRGQVAEFFSSLTEAQDVLEFEPQQFVAQNDTVVVLGRYAWRVKKTGLTFRSPWTHVFTVRNGKVVSFDEYLDTAVAAAAYRA